MSESHQSPLEISRRQFLKQMATAAPTLAVASGSALPGLSAERVGAPANSKKFVAMQIGGRSFVDEGVDRCLDTLQETGGVNVLMSTVFTYGSGLAGRQVHEEPLPDHGIQEYDRVHGGSFTRVHPEFYADSPIKDFRAPELGNFDILADVIPKAKAKGMLTYALFEENYNPRLIPNFEKIAEVDLYGRPGNSTCFNNPGARAFLSSMVADWVSNNDIDGMMWESERQGPLNNTIGASFNKIFPRRAILHSIIG
jgi:hypothetical protein